MAPEAAIGTNALTAGSVWVLGKSTTSVQSLTQKLLSTSDEMYRSGRINRQPVAEFIKGETNASVNISIKTKDYLLARGMTAYPTGIAFDIGLPEHLAQVIGYSQKKNYRCA